MASLTELHEKRGKLVTQARDALEEITKNTNETRTKELEERHDKIMAEFDATEKSIAREERQAEIERQDQERRERQRPNGNDIETRAAGDHDGGDKPGKSAKEQRQAEYRDAFDAFLRSGADIGALTNEQRTILRAGHDPEVRVQVAGTAASGGYTVPVELAREIVRTMKDWGPMFDGNVVREISTGSGNEFDIPTNDDTSGSASALAEGADLTNDNSGDLAFGQKRLDAYVDGTPWVKISFELMQELGVRSHIVPGRSPGRTPGPAHQRPPDHRHRREPAQRHRYRIDAWQDGRRHRCDRRGRAARPAALGARAVSPQPEVPLDVR